MRPFSFASDGLALITSFLLILSLCISFFHSGQGLYALPVALVCLIAALVLSVYAAWRREPSLVCTAVPLLLLPLLFWVFAGIAWSRIPYLSVITAWWLAPFILACWIVVLSSGRAFPYAALIASAVLCALLQSGLALYQFFILEGLPNGLFLYQNLLGGFLSLVVFVLSGLFLVQREAASRKAFLLLPLLFPLAFMLGFLQSRGVILSFSLAMLFFLGAAWWYLKAERKAILLLGITFALAFVCAEGTTLSGMSQRLLTIENPYAAGQSRFIIWLGCLEMIRDYPLWGTGLGTYWLLWPPYRSPADESGGYFAHNDYLQLWIEGGLPLILLLLGVMLILAVSFVRTMRSDKPAGVEKIEALAIFAALVALAIHTFFDFNFYTMPTMLLAGAMLGRFDGLSRARKRAFSFAVWGVSRPVFNTCLLLAALGVVGHLFFMGLSYHLCEQGIRLASEKRFAAASDSLDQAAKLWPAYDKPLYSHAHLLGSLIRQNPDTVTRRALYTQAGAYLDRAERANPYRPQTWVIRGLLEEAVEGDRHKVKEFFKKALSLDPRYFQARVAYARFVMDGGGDADEALSILEEGMPHYYPNFPEVIPYFQWTAVLRKKAGDLPGAQELEDRISAILRRQHEEEAKRKRSVFF